MAANSSQNETTVRRLLETLTGLWAACKNAFQTLGNLVTAWSSTPSDIKYPSEKLVKTSLDGKASSTHTHSVKINGATKTIAASEGTAVDLDYHPTARAVTATSVKDAIQELRVLPGGSVGSVNLAADNSVENVKIPAGWYNYIWTPHRAGASGGDHQNYGSLILMSMVSRSPQTFVVEGANLADASPVYRCRLLSQVAAMGSAYFGNNAKYRKIGTLSGPGSTGDTCATFLVCADIANVTKQSAILNVDIRNGGGTYTFNISLTELTGAASWTSKLKLFKNGGNIYLYGLGASGAYYSVEVTPLAVTDLTGTQVPGMWAPDTSNTDESSVSYTAITYGTTQYVAKSSTLGLLKNDGSVDTTAYSQKPVAESKFDGIHLLLGEAGATPQSASFLQYYGDNNNGSILMVGDNAASPKFTNNKSMLRLYRGTQKNTQLIATGNDANNNIYLPTSSGGTLALQGGDYRTQGLQAAYATQAGFANESTYAAKIGSSASHPNIGSQTRPVWVDSNGNVQECSDPSRWSVGTADYADLARYVYSTEFGGCDKPTFIKTTGQTNVAELGSAFDIPHVVTRWHEELYYPSTTGFGIIHRTDKFSDPTTKPLSLSIEISTNNSSFDIRLDGSSLTPWYGGQVWGTIKWDSQSGSNLNSAISRIGISNIADSSTILATRNISTSNQQDIQGHVLFAICTGDFLHRYVVDMEISLIKPQAGSSVSYVSVVSKCHSVSPVV